MSRPVISVLAGVNGAGKSSIGGYLLSQQGATWFNPDTFARALVQEFAYQQEDANAAAWGEGLRRLDLAIALGKSFAFETTLGGDTITKRLLAACATHDILVWFCGLRDAEQHIARVRLRVAQGGHDIPEARIRQRCLTSVRNLLALMPRLTELRVYDNSLEVAPGEAIPDPRLVLYLQDGGVLFPATLQDALGTPDWAKPLVEAALEDAA
jgi:predicted ABC-type ATPase